MAGGYTYGEPEPHEKCPCCGGRAFAEFCDVGVGMVQIEPYQCGECGASEAEMIEVKLPDGRSDWTWAPMPKPSERGEHVTGYLIKPNGYVWETTFDDDHKRLVERMRTSMSQLLWEGCVRITNLEGFVVDLPPFLTAAARRELSKTLRAAEEEWGPPYVRQFGQTFGREMTVAETMSLVSKLPPERQATAPAVEAEEEATASPRM